MITNNRYEIFIIGVGGQGIGVLSELLLRACDYCGYKVKSVETHGLAQRGGTVSSHLRLGTNVYSPIIMSNSADMVVSLERNEAMRGMNDQLKDNGTLVYYDTSWQPLNVRLTREKNVSTIDIQNIAEERGIKVFRTFKKDIPDIRMQNIVLLALIAKEKLIPQLAAEDYRSAMRDIMKDSTLELNLALFDQVQKE
ncbi:MAG TPA: 2-oxoacid:acceptor oxidoreductase family protein [Petrotogaceae bacterium]|nr:2-oxoacid:acceptor oxidoreductase family protein [Petrotogaceae bacterium]HPO27156.1 2-oxoacid:acceptor oxidoreductase family protein [Petrotogaceae bacterium]